MLEAESGPCESNWHKALDGSFLIAPSTPRQNPHLSPGDFLGDGATRRVYTLPRKKALTLRVANGLEGSVRNLDSQIEHCLDLHRLAGDHVPEGLPLQQFHGYERPPIGFVDLVYRANARVVQGGSGLGFALEA